MSTTTPPLAATAYLDHRLYVTRDISFSRVDITSYCRCQQETQLSGSAVPWIFSVHRAKLKSNECLQSRKAKTPKKEQEVAMDQKSGKGPQISCRQ